MKKALTDLKSFITVVTMLLFGFCIVTNKAIPDELQNVLATVVGFFLGSKVIKDDAEDITEIKR